MAGEQLTFFTSEIWKPVITEGFESIYEVSNLGRVRSMPRRIQGSNRDINYSLRILKQNIDTGGYSQVTLCNSTTRRTIGVHVLVAESFICPRPLGLDVCHNDGRATHNHPENLRWGTRSENVKDKYLHGTHNWLRSYTPRDKAHLRLKSKQESQLYMEGDCSCGIVALAA